MQKVRTNRFVRGENKMTHGSVSSTMLVLTSLIALSACQIAGVTTRAAPPERHAYAGPHGRPRAYGAGVCAITSHHTHSYPPVPARAFRMTPQGAVDERPRYPFWEPHAHHKRSCFRNQWHLHLDPPRIGLLYDAHLDAYREGPFLDGIELENFFGGHPPRQCDRVRCVYQGPHGHAPCGLRKKAKAAKAADVVKKSQNN